MKVNTVKIRSLKEFKLIKLENTSAVLETIREMEMDSFFGKTGKNMKETG